MQQQISCKQSIMVWLWQMVANSGKFVNRMGSYTACTQNSMMQYRWLSIRDDVNNGPVLNWGLCLPHQCSNQLIKQTINTKLQQISSNFIIIDIQSQLNTQKDPLNYKTYILLSILTIIALLTIVCTLYDSFGRQKPNNRYMKAFSLKQNIKIFKYKPNKLNAFNGLKAYFMFWIILGHEYFFNLGVVNNSLTFLGLLLSPFFLVVEAGMLAVDAFLFIGGFFVAFAIIQDNNYNIIKVPLLVVNRLLRFWPTYLIAILLFAGLLPYLGEGPYWSLLIAQLQPCSHWWRPLLFLDNLIENGRQICMSWGWYLQVDMQLFVITLIIISLYNKHKRLTVLIIIATILASLSFTMYINYSHKFKQPIHLDDFGPDDTSFNDVHIKPWCRCPPYLYGVLFGIFYLQTREQSKRSIQKNMFGKLLQILQRRAFQFLFEIAGIFIIVFLIVIPRTSQIGYRWNSLANSIYLTFSKILFTIGLSLLALPSLMDKKTLISVILDNKFTNFISKISFTVYLIHLLVILQFSDNQKTESYYSIVNLFVLFVGHSTISCSIATLMVLTIQAPFYSLQKILMANIKIKIKTAQNDKIPLITSGRQPKA